MSQIGNFYHGGEQQLPLRATITLSQLRPKQCLICRNEISQPLGIKKL